MRMEDAIVISARVRSGHYGKLSGGLARCLEWHGSGHWRPYICPEWPCARYDLSSLPPCFPGFAEPGGEAKNGPGGPSEAIDFIDEIWSGRRDSNPRPQPWQGCESSWQQPRGSQRFFVVADPAPRLGKRRSNHRSKSLIRTVAIS